MNVLDPSMGSGHFLVEVAERIARFLVELGVAPEEPKRAASWPTGSGGWPSPASTAWTRTRWPWTSPSSRSGSPPWRGTARSPSSTTT